ncbi:Acetyltransferase (GNAT) family protein [Rubritalea squalenifaciens DSM 18772]|uniref:Acetyltransferase (GNAT) family protein n=3 Tax=Rubritalea TaxID=361050 RepID=A0A1M6IXT4_9BACT|nr:GNAT family N-acetyltransferase [Rubritalea squalenifaciens]SHJ39241.1 Acetyltransferase (GNAT) family protein [Rubritalea squalenifaciens DSM 18772]
MIDMLVNLYELPDSREIYEKVEQQGITLRRARAYERHIVAEWVGRHFSPKWVSEVKIAFSRQPVACFIATKDKEILGFACIETTAKGFYGPTGVGEAARGTGIGKALLFMCMEALRESGYVYGVIGGVGPREFYEKVCGATEIPNSDPGIYRDILPG